jgi:hypothetical protein
LNFFTKFYLILINLEGIIGGQTATAGQFPFSAAIYLNTNGLELLDNVLMGNHLVRFLLLFNLIISEHPYLPFT